MAWDANQITKINQNLMEVMDTLVAHNAKTSAMVASAKIKPGATAKNVLVATPSTKGAGDYSATSGWSENVGTLTWESYTLAYDRGTKFLIDALETQETANLATASMFASEFMRTQMVPEIDAVRIARASAKAVATGHTGTAALTKANIFSTINDAAANIYDRTGIDEGLTIYVSTSQRKNLEGSTEYTRTRSILDGGKAVNNVTESVNGNNIVYVPASRMFTQVTMNSGVGNNGGFTGAGRNVEFLICAPESAQGVVSYSNITVLPKGSHTEGDGDFYAYRVYHDCITPKEKTGGLYAHTSAISP